MASSEIKQILTPSIKASIRAQLLNRLKFSAILQLPEQEFAKLIAEVEHDPLFKKLTHWKTDEGRVVGFKKFASAQLSTSFYELNEQLKSATENVDVELMMNKHKGIVALIKKIGQEKFEKYFLYREDPATPEEIAKECTLSLEEVEMIQSLLLEISIHSEFLHPSQLPQTEGLHFHLIAKFEIENHGRISYSYFSPHMAYGRYIVNHDKLSHIKTELTPEEKKQLNPLLSKMDWINARHDTVHKILHEITSVQELYLINGHIEMLMPYSQRTLAKAIQVAPSTVTRAIFSKSIMTPWGEEKKLKSFFVSKKQVVQVWAEKFIEEKKLKNEKWTDEQMREAFIHTFNSPISRRSINAYKKIIKK